MKEISYSMLVPDEYQIELMAIRDLQTGIYWSIGDITLEVIEYVRANFKNVNKMVVYDAVGSYAGKASRTVREYAAIAKFYPPEIREAYDALTFDHFRNAALLDNWREALDWAMERSAVTGKPASADEMLYNFSKYKEKKEEFVDGEDHGIIVLSNMIRDMRTLITSGTILMDRDQYARFEDALAILEDIVSAISWRIEPAPLDLPILQDRHKDD